MKPGNAGGAKGCRKVETGCLERTEDTGGSPVAQSAGKRAGDAGSERPTAEPPVWTKRMLATLEKGVTGGKWYSLIDKLYPDRHAGSGVCRGDGQPGAAGVDHVSIEDTRRIWKRTWPA